METGPASWFAENSGTHSTPLASMLVIGVSVVLAAILAATALATDEEETEGPCSTSMPPLVSETMEILSEPHVQEILEMAVANNVTLNLTSVNPRPDFTNVNWVPPTSEE